MKFFRNKKINKVSRVRGFSLIEMIIYILMLTMLMTTVVRSMVTITSSYGTLRGTKAITSSAEVLFNRLNYEVKNSLNLSGTFGTSSGSLTLNQGATTTVFLLDSSGRVVISVNGVSDYLTSSEVKVTKLAFYKLQATSTSFGVTMQTTMKSQTDPKVKAENFESTVLLRKTIQ